MGELQHEPFQFAFNGFLSVAYQGRGKTEIPADTEQVRLGSPGSNRRRRSVPVTSCQRWTPKFGQVAKVDSDLRMERSESCRNGKNTPLS